MIAVIVAGGDLIPSKRIYEAVQTADLLIAVDSGVRHLELLGRHADLLLGDFDSFHPDPAGDTECLRFPAEKDQTDAHLGLREAVRRGFSRILLLGALRGPRLDHGAANLLLIASDEFDAVDLRALDGPDELFAVRRPTEVGGSPGDLVTLLAITPVCNGVTTIGLTYPLSGAELARGDTRGVSNVMTGDVATVSVSSGVLLVVHRDGGDPNRLV